MRRYVGRVLSSRLPPGGGGRRWGVSPARGEREQLFPSQALAVYLPPMLREAEGAEIYP